jgi:hypothetical protein
MDFSLPCHWINVPKSADLGRFFEGSGHGLPPRLGDGNADFNVFEQVGGRVESDELLTLEDAPIRWMFAMRKTHSRREVGWCFYVNSRSGDVPVAGRVGDSDGIFRGGKLLGNERWVL